jgi:hypothetical protein
MITPTLYSSDVSNDFKSRESLVSISIDTLQVDNTASLKVLIQLEPPSVKNIISSVIQNHKNFDIILGWHPDILNSCSNAKLFLFGDCWIDVENFKYNKRDHVTFLTSYKSFTEGHILRQQVFEFLKNYKNKKYTIYSLKTPPRIEKKDIIFEEAKFSIIIENEKCENWITEKLIDCFVTKTIPIYWGCTNLEEYFDMKGVIPFSSFEELTDILDNLDPRRYEESSSVIQDNYEKALTYCDFYKRVDEEIDLVI